MLDLVHNLSNKLMIQSRRIKKSQNSLKSLKKQTGEDFRELQDALNILGAVSRESFSIWSLIKENLNNQTHVDKLKGKYPTAGSVVKTFMKYRQKSLEKDYGLTISMYVPPASSSGPFTLPFEELTELMEFFAARAARLEASTLVSHVVIEGFYCKISFKDDGKHCNTQDEQLFANLRDFPTFQKLFSTSRDLEVSRNEISSIGTEVTLFFKNV